MAEWINNEDEIEVTMTLCKKDITMAKLWPNDDKMIGKNNLMKT